MTARRLIPILVALASSLVIGGVATAGVADRAGHTFGSMADEFIKAFQPVEGLVLQVEGDRMYLDLGAAAQVGQEVTIYRKGEPFRHPYTGKPMGHYEDVLGHAQVTRVQPRYAEGRFIPAPNRPPPAPEDGARITRGRLKIAVTPVIDLTGTQADLRRVPYLMAVTLERSKRFQVVDPITVSDTLVSSAVRVEEVLARPERATRAASSLEVSAWVVPILIERRGVTYLDVTWISAVTGTALLSRRQALLAPEGSEEQRFPWEPRSED